MSKGNPRFPIPTTLTILFLCFSTQTIQAHQNNPSPFCVSSSCGQIAITYPFRLATDPPNCGHPDPIFKLECQESQTILISDSRKFNVQSISYNNFTMRITDPGIVSTNYSSCPVYQTLADHLYSAYISIYFSNSIGITFLNCLNPVNNPSYVENLACVNRTNAFSNSSRIYSYLLVGEFPRSSELEPSCTYDMATQVASSFNGMISSNNNSDYYSYSTIHDWMAYGLELNWYLAMCGECEKSDGRCSVENDKIRCRHYCYEDTPFEERSFWCKLEYYGLLLFLVGITLGSIIGLRFIIGVTFIIGLVIYRRRKQRLSMDKSKIKEDGIEQERGASV